MQTTVIAGAVVVAGVIIAFAVVQSNKEPTPQERARQEIEYIQSVSQEMTNNLNDATESVKVRTAIAELKTLQTGIDLYALDNRDQFPQTLRDLVTGSKKYVTTVGRDPWGNEYIYIAPGKRNPNYFDLYSMGPDGRRDSSDDIIP